MYILIERQADRKPQNPKMSVSTHIYISRQRFGLLHLENIEPEPKKKFAESIVRSLNGLDTGVGGACHNHLLAIGG